MTGGSHFDQLAVVGLSVKGGMNRNAAFAKGFLHIEGNFHIGAVLVRYLLNDCIE